MELKLVPPTEPDAFDDAFFQQSSIAPVELELSDEDVEEWHDEAPLPKGSRRTMHVALGMLGVSFAGLGGFLVYAKLIMPTPVELSATGVSAPSVQPLAASDALVPEVQHAAPVLATREVAAAPTAVPSFEAGDPGGPGVPLRVPSMQAAPSTQAASSAPRGPDAWVKQAFRSLNRGDARQAIVQARHALETAPARADAWLVIGSAYDALHDRPSAQLAFRSCAERASGPQAKTCELLIRN